MDCCGKFFRPRDSVTGMKRRPLVHEQLTRSVIGAFYEVYNTLGFGFTEHIYLLALEGELPARGHWIEREV